ncbi:MAG: toll/interleukin-1 receptor domain-containing protein [Anaerolineae bacterium]|jgi:hypothetical protein|nr:toll/interleukin-1 receptor domain-containing protein [Anaerolineae bacterium]MBT7988485.1 toll/interleukin-1 receptor domain-containing protein [Anaerolineae bacterium]
MDKDIFISYSRRDQEFVTRLAADLDTRVAGAWFDQSAIQVGQNWHDEIMDGIRECKAFVLVLSPDAAESRYVREEVNKALELGKPIIPVLYRPAKWTGEFAALVHDIQTLDLRMGSYRENFQELVDGLIAVGAVKVEGYEKPFMRGETKVGLSVVFRKIPGWAFAWGGGWTAFWLIICLLLLGLLIGQNESDGSEIFPILFVLLFSGGAGGFVGGLFAGLFTMLALRPNAPSISWKHMSPTIRIWAISGPLGMVVSGVVTALMVALGAISIQGNDVSCEGLGFGECLGAGIGNAIGEVIVLVLIILLVFFLLVGVVWFLTGMFAGRQVVRHIRRLEPGITSAQSRRVSVGWGCGALVATIIVILVIGALSSIIGL